MAWLGAGCMKYSFDANALIGPWRRTYPIDVFPPFWDHIDEMMQRGEITIVAEVFHELEMGGDDLYQWVSQRSIAVVEMDAPIQQSTRDILSKFPRLINARKQRSMADPFVIAHAKLIGGTVVSEEPKSGNPNQPRIPDVCDALGIPCITPLQYIRARGLVFRVL